MNRSELFNRIQNEICYNTINSLSDYQIIQEYKYHKNIYNKLKVINNVLNTYGINDKNIMNDFAYALTPINVLNQLKKDKFNKIVLENINKLELDIKPIIKINKKYDWCLSNKKNKKTLYGINIIDINKCKKMSEAINNINSYNDNFNNHTNIIYVICNNIYINNLSNRTIEFLQKGFMNNKVCYIKGLIHSINRYIK